MIIKTEITIQKSLTEVWSHFTNMTVFKEWNPGIKTIEHIEGELGRPGSVRLITFEKEGKVTATKETILKREDPQSLTLVKLSDSITELSENSFEEMPNGDTYYRSVSHYEFSGFRKYLSFFFKSSLEKTQKLNQQNLKKFIEAK